MCDLADFFTCFESFGILTLHSLYIPNYFFKVELSLRLSKKFYLRIDDILILKNKAFLYGVNLCLKFYDGNLGDMLT